MQRMLSSIGKENGINFKYGGRTGNTRDSHRLVQLAKSKSPQIQTAVMEQLFRAYFEEEKDITSDQVLLEAGTQAGLDEAEVKKLLGSNQMGEIVDEEVLAAQMGRISGVPHFVIQKRYEIGGAVCRPSTSFQVIADTFNSKNPIPSLRSLRSSPQRKESSRSARARLADQVSGRCI